MMHACPQPDLFRPERFMEDPNILDPREVVFGYGRRSEPIAHAVLNAFTNTVIGGPGYALGDTLLN